MKRILLLGATGFIGSEIVRALDGTGHSVTGLGRDLDLARRLFPEMTFRIGDLRRLQWVRDWLPLLDDIDVVINASGALQTGLRDNVDQVQSVAIRALISACVERGIDHFVQISASNADRSSPNAFMASKGEADAVLTGSGLSHTILRPGLVIARNAFGGTEMLRMSASLPGMLPDIRGTGAVQCIAMSDLIEGVLKAVNHPADAQGTIDLVERDGRPLVEVIALHRRWLGHPPARWRLRVPRWLLHPLSLGADALGWLGWRSPLRTNSIAALIAGVSGHSTQTQSLLGRALLSLERMLTSLPPSGKADRWHGRAALVYPLALFCLFVLWAGSGLLGIVHLPKAAEILRTAGIPQALAADVAVLASCADLAVALLLVVRRTTRLALVGMLGLSLAYLAGSILLPELWFDPLAPMIKVLPAVALVLFCLAMVDER